jgi:tRNA (guanine37-N1)-methyltransferase
MYRQSDAKGLAADNRDLIIICPRYEGYDERVTQWVDRQYCIGNYVLTGGELPALIIIDSVVRLLPGVLGGENSAELESFQADDQSVEYPQYTRPEDFRGQKVPEVLLTGNHAEIAKWRQAQQTGQ